VSLTVESCFIISLLKFSDMVNSQRKINELHLPLKCFGLRWCLRGCTKRRGCGAVAGRQLEMEFDAAAGVESEGSEQGSATHPLGRLSSDDASMAGCTTGSCSDVSATVTLDSDDPPLVNVHDSAASSAAAARLPSFPGAHPSFDLNRSASSASLPSAKKAKRRGGNGKPRGVRFIRCMRPTVIENHQVSRTADPCRSMVFQSLPMFFQSFPRQTAALV
jgi:hypothetical protein